MALNHVALTVADRKRSADFYGRHFGLTERVHEDDHLLILGDGDGSLLALSEGPNEARSLPRTTHFGFLLESPEQVVAARGTLSRDGVEEAEWGESGPTRVQVFDPDGYRVELYAY